MRQEETTDPWCDDDSLESVEDGFDGNGGVHTAEPEHRVRNRRRPVVKWLDYQGKPWKTSHTDYVMNRRMGWDRRSQFRCLLPVAYELTSVAKLVSTMRGERSSIADNSNVCMRDFILSEQNLSWQRVFRIWHHQIDKPSKPCMYMIVEYLIKVIIL